MAPASTSIQGTMAGKSPVGREAGGGSSRYGEVS
jgi:hypothetical protein